MNGTPVTFEWFTGWILEGGLTAALLTVIWLLRKGELLWRQEFTNMEKYYQARLDDKDKRIEGLVDERNRLFDMVIGEQQKTAKSLDIASIAIAKNTPR
jgi:hypothetical protein